MPQRMRRSGSAVVVRSSCGPAASAIVAPGAAVSLIGILGLVLVCIAFSAVQPALLVFVPRWTHYGALLLTCTVGLGAVLSWPRPADFGAGLSLTLLAASLAWLTRPRRVEIQYGH
mgnify:CR=1 FL=1